MASIVLVLSEFHGLGCVSDLGKKCWWWGLRWYGTSALKILFTGELTLCWDIGEVKCKFTACTLYESDITCACLYFLALPG